MLRVFKALKQPKSFSCCLLLDMQAMMYNWNDSVLLTNLVALKVRGYFQSIRQGITFNFRAPEFFFHPPVSLLCEDSHSICSGVSKAFSVGMCTRGFADKHRPTQLLRMVKIYITIFCQRYQHNVHTSFPKFTPSF